MYKRYTGMRARLPVGMPVTFVTPNKIVRMRWGAQYLSGATVGVLMGLTAFSANDIWSVAGGARQPMGFDQLAQIYNNYVVLGSRIRLAIARSHIEPPVAVPSSTWFLYWSNTPQNAPVAAYATVPEYLDAQKGNWVTTPGEYDGNTKYLSCTYAPGKAYGDQLDMGSAPAMLGTLIRGPPVTGTSPLVRNTFHITHSAGLAGQDVPAGAYIITVIIDFVVMLGSPQVVLGS